MSEECLLFDEPIIADSSDRAMYRAVHGSELEGLLNSKSPHGRKETPPKQAVADARGCKPMMLTRWRGHKKTEENTCLLGLPADHWEILVAILSGSLNCSCSQRHSFYQPLWICILLRWWLLYIAVLSSERGALEVMRKSLDQSSLCDEDENAHRVVNMLSCRSQSVPKALEVDG